MLRIGQAIRSSNACNASSTDTAIQQRLELDSATQVVGLKYFDKDWESYIDIENYNQLPDRARIQCDVELQIDVPQDSVTNKDNVLFEINVHRSNGT